MCLWLVCLSECPADCLSVGSWSFAFWLIVSTGMDRAVMVVVDTDMIERCTLITQCAVMLATQPAMLAFPWCCYMPKHGLIEL